jgi:hypothetical protein
MPNPSDPSEEAASACEAQPKATLPFNSLVQKNQTLINNLNINTCKTTNVTTPSVSVSNSGSFLGASNSSSMSIGSGTAQSASSCQGLSVLLQTNNYLTQQIHCIISEDTTNSTITITNENTITIDVTGNLIAECPVEQTISGTIQAVSNISPNCAIKIQKAAQDSIKTFASQLKNMYKGSPSYSPNGEGTQAVNAIVSAQTQNDIGNQVSDVISTINESVFDGNTYTLKVGGNLVLSPVTGSCGSVTQEIIVDIMASSIATSVFTSALKGADLNALMPPILPPAKSNTTLIIIALVIALLICAGLAYYFLIYKRSGKVITPKVITPKVITPKFKYARRF